MNRAEVISGLRNNLTKIKRFLPRHMLGQTHDGKRDIYKIAGYPTELEFEDYDQMYGREDIASRIVDAPVQETWRNLPKIYDDSDPETETEFEKAWKALVKRLRVFYYFVRVDKLAGIGHYGILLIGVNDGSGSNLETPVQSVTGPDSILYLQPLKQGRVKSITYNDDASSPRYNQPEFYEIQFERRDEKKPDNPKRKVHWSRIIHIAEGLTEDEVHGEPRLMKVYNRLLDLQKVVAGGGEIWWLNARGIIHADLKDDFDEGDLSNEDEQLKKFKEEIENLQHHLTHIAKTAGVNLKILHTPVPNPKPMFDVIVSLIAVAKSIPKRLLTGTERGQLASTQDANNYAKVIMARQQEYAEPVLIRQFIDRLVQWRALPAPKDGDYEVEWEDLLAPTPKDKSEVLQQQLQAVKNYIDAIVKDPTTMLIISPSEVRDAIGLDSRTEGELNDLKELLTDLDALLPPEPPAPPVPPPPSGGS